MVTYGLLAGMADEAQTELFARCRRRRFKRGEVVFHDGDPGDTLHLVAKGHFAVRATTPLGDTAMLRVYRPGDSFGELAVIEPAPRAGTVVALEDGDTLSLAHGELDALRAVHPGVDHLLTLALIGEVRRLAGALVEALYLPVEQRLWRRLVDLAEIYGDEGATKATVPFTQEDLAQLAGTTRPTANKLLRAGEGSGVVRMARGRIEVLDIKAAKALGR
jgi:CRP/FNR family cyclic AMP-dependent transcriptional regulator